MSMELKSSTGVSSAKVITAVIFNIKCHSYQQTDRNWFPSPQGQILLFPTFNTQTPSPNRESGNLACPNCYNLITTGAIIRHNTQPLNYTDKTVIFLLFLGVIPELETSITNIAIFFCQKSTSTFVGGRSRRSL
jgi:hypothetical protein